MNNDINKIPLYVILAVWAVTFVLMGIDAFKVSVGYSILFLVVAALAVSWAVATK